MDLSNDFHALVDLFVRLIQSQAGKQVLPESAWLDHGQVLAKKFLFHVISTHTVAQVKTIQTEILPPTQFVDHSSVKILGRSAIETYLVFYYIYINPDRSLSNFRYKTWEIAGLMDRQKHYLIDLKYDAQLLEERINLNQLLLDIQKSKHFLHLNEKQRKKILEGHWKNGKSWQSLAINAGINEKYFKNLYSYLSGYSHSSYISALQIQQSNEIGHQISLTKAILQSCLVFMAHFIHAYPKLFNDSQKVLDDNPLLHKIAKRWCFTDAEFDKLYI